MSGVQHVVLVHFPIAVSITAVGFDYAAQWTDAGLGGRGLLQL
jgi:uncharacterized membrane protein